MSHVRRIVIWGTSVFLMSIEAGLAALPGMEVVRLNPHLPGAEARIMALSPDVVIVGHNGGSEGLVLALLDRGFPLIELDAAQGMLIILNGCRVQVSEMEDLVRVIEQIANGGPSEHIITPTKKEFKRMFLSRRRIDVKAD
ncbi:MAG: hypothetical protein E3J21_14900 [Anaerolineales bacterium]|nr:MAG: hypothetical protein E3J21_14900 [Anaerolineales bacterium]